jgi:predicted negative regulator of RcsB-dependent stress response
MPQTLIVIFLLFFAVLAFGWFYWQRAKTRTAPTATTPTDTAEPTDTTPAS